VKKMRRTVPLLVAVVCMVVLTAVGFGVGWLVHPEQEPEAEAVVRQVAAILEGPHAGLAQHDDAVAIADLFAEDARAIDGPSGETVEGRDAIQGGWQYVFAQGGTWKVDQVFAQDPWGLILATWTGTNADGATVSPRFGMLLGIEDGRIVSEYDLYDAASYPF
jgi:hypothetical protein